LCDEGAEPKLLLNSILLVFPDRTDPSIRSELFSNIVLGGGITLMPGFSGRICKELKLRANLERVKVIASSNRLYSAFIGCSLLSSLATFEKMWITKAEYDESGPFAVHRIEHRIEH
jgi:actin